MQAALDQFRANIARVRNLGGIYRALEGQTTSAVDLSDLLRAELVLAVSALDQYIHELVRLGMLEINRGTRQETRAFTQFSMPLGTVKEWLLDPDDEQRLDSEIRSQFSRRSFQQPDRIAEAIRHFSGEALWANVGRNLGLLEQDVRSRLQLIVDRRNKIAHEADLDPASFGDRWPIDTLLVDNAIEFIERVGEAIFAVVA